LISPAPKELFRKKGNMTKIRKIDPKKENPSDLIPKK